MIHLIPNVLRTLGVTAGAVGIVGAMILWGAIHDGVGLPKRTYPASGLPRDEFRETTERIIGGVAESDVLIRFDLRTLAEYPDIARVFVGQGLVARGRRGELFATRKWVMSSVDFGRDALSSRAFAIATGEFLRLSDVREMPETWGGSGGNVTYTFLMRANPKGDLGKALARAGALICDSPNGTTHWRGRETIGMGADTISITRNITDHGEQLEFDCPRLPGVISRAIR